MRKPICGHCLVSEATHVVRWYVEVDYLREMRRAPKGERPTHCISCAAGMVQTYGVGPITIYAVHVGGLPYYFTDLHIALQVAQQHDAAMDTIGGFRAFEGNGRHFTSLMKPIPFERLNVLPHE